MIVLPLGDRFFLEVEYYIERRVWVAVLKDWNDGRTYTGESPDRAAAVGLAVLAYAEAVNRN